MDLKELPAELASFVQQALASGTYQSADELVAEAVRVLRDREAERQARPHTPDTPAPAGPARRSRAAPGGALPRALAK